MPSGPLFRKATVCVLDLIVRILKKAVRSALVSICGRQGQHQLTPSASFGLLLDVTPLEPESMAPPHRGLSLQVLYHGTPQPRVGEL